MVKKKEESKWHHHNDASSGIYGLAFIGALIYFIQRADGFWMVVLAVLKAIIWPVLVVYQLLKYFNL